MSDSTARAVSTVGIWLAFAIVLTFGVFHTSWDGPVAMLVMVFLVVAMCGAAAYSTAFVWGWKPSKLPWDASPEKMKM